MGILKSIRGFYLYGRHFFTIKLDAIHPQYELYLESEITGSATFIALVDRIEEAEEYARIYLES